MSSQGIYPNRMADVKPRVAPQTIQETRPSRPIDRAQWEERKDPKKIEWVDGLLIEGVLLAVESVMIRDRREAERGRDVQKSTMRYTVLEDETNEPVFFFGTHQLNQKLRPTDIGRFVSIRCEGDDKEAGRNGQAMKVFNIKVSRNMAPGYAHDGTPITDDDLPPANAY